VRLVDDADIAIYGALPRYGGGPPILAEKLGEAYAYLLAGCTSSHAAELLDFAQRSSFSDAFLRATGWRPSEFQAMHHVCVRPRRGGGRCLVPRKIRDRTGQGWAPLPTFAASARKKAEREAKKHKRQLPYL
jgi:hypothetical protein